MSNQLHYYQCNCLKSGDTNQSLRQTFKFIQAHQVNADQTVTSTGLYLGVALTQSLGFNNYNEREEAFNYIVGTIKKVGEYAVVIESQSECVGQISEFSIAYGEIQNIRSDVIRKYYEAYRLYMEELPPLCESCDNKWTDLLKALDQMLYILKGRRGIMLYILYARIFSLGYEPDQVEVIRNLVVFNGNGIIPITMINGFFSVAQPKVTIKEGENNDK